MRNTFNSSLAELGPYLTYCLDKRSELIPFTSLTLPRWSLFFISIAVFAAVMFFSSKWLLGLLLGVDRKTWNPNKTRRCTFSLWACISVVPLWIWITTWFVEPHMLGRVLRIAAIFITLPLIFLLEGLGAALTEVKDKEIPHTWNSRRQNQITEIVGDFQHKLEPYLRAREWLMAALTIFLAVLAEFEDYQVPFFGRFEGTLARIFITTMLATIAVIWIAQTPAKDLGRRDPLALLVKRVTRIAHRLVLFTLEKTERFCINDPSDIALRAIRTILNIPASRNDNSLPPGGDLVFTELVHRYGYADCDVIEIYDINEDDGSCTFTQNELVYVDPGLRSYRRKFLSEHGFKGVPTVSFDVFRIPQLGVNIKQDLEKWRMIAATDTPVANKLFQQNISWEDLSEKPTMEPAQQTTAVIDIDWNPGDIRPRIKTTEALLIRVSTMGQMTANAFKKPADSNQTPDDSKKDYWSRKLAKPCYEATTTIRMREGARPAFFLDQKYSAEQDKKEQALETARFQREQEEEIDGDVDVGTLTVRLSRGLPGCSYRVQWYLRSS